MVGCVGFGLRAAEAAAVTLGLTFNALLCLLVIRHTSSELQNYSRILLCTCAIDMFFALSSYITEVHPDIRNGLTVLVSVGIDLHVEKMYVFCFYLFTLYYAVCGTCVGMVYRYLAVCRDYTVNNLQLLSLYVCVSALAATVPVAAYFSYVPAILKTGRAYASVISAYPCRDKIEVYIAPVQDLWANGPPLLAADSVVALTYATIIFCGYKINRFVRSSTVARESLKFQNQVHLALIAQAIVPLVLIVIPLGGAIAVLLLGLEQLHFFVLSCTGFVAWIPVVNPLCAMYFIRPYRREIKRRFASTVFVSRSSIQPQRLNVLFSRSY